MRKRNQISLYIFLLLGGISLFSCNDDFLNTKPLDQVSSADVWVDGSLAEAFVTEIYNGLGNGGFDEQMLASLSDEAMFTHTGRSINTINEGILNASNTGWVSNTYAWDAMYGRIRSCNLAIENLATATFDDDALNERLVGEAQFLRAYFYQQLLRYYGGVPLIEKSYGLNEDYTIARNSYEECVNFIVSECDAAASKLEGKSLAKGRATKWAALALKARVLLYAASDLHDIPTASANSSLISSYSNPEILGYTSGDRQQRWQKAKDAAKVLLDANQFGYKIGLTEPVSPEEGRKNYISIAMAGGSPSPDADAAGESEIIFGRYNTPNKNENMRRQGLYNGPNGYHNWAGNTPIGQMVDDYEMMDGTTFDWDNSEHAASPYENRDPRFYASILYDGAPWKPRDLISGNVDPANEIQTGEYEGSSGNIPGLDTRKSSIEDWNGSWTGYYCRKFVDPDNALIDNKDNQFIPWPFFRYTEMMFNYAEASIELGQEEEARNWLNQIRFRAGMPAITASGEELVRIFRNEKRVEMFLEEQRYHDARRWMIAEETLGRKVQYINIIGSLKPGATPPSPYKKDTSLYTYKYTPSEVNNQEDRLWVDKMYFRPIARNEVNRNDKLIQNPGYDE